MKLTSSSARLLHKSWHVNVRRRRRKRRSWRSSRRWASRTPGENKRAWLRALLGMRACQLLEAAMIDWLPAGSRLSPRFSPSSMRSTYLRNTRGRRAGAEPGSPIWRFHEIVARTRGQHDQTNHA